MRKIFLVLVFFILPFTGYAETIPRPAGWVNDFANVIDAGTAGKITVLAGEVEQKTTVEIAVVTVGSIAPHDEKEYARLLFDSWKPGKKGKDNGVLVLVAISERRWRIETGYGVEGILPDGLCGEIGRTYMVPNFKEGKFGEGLYQGVLAIADVIAKDAHVSLTSLSDFEERASRDQSSSSGSNDAATVFFLIVIFIVFIVMSVFRSRGGYYGGGYYGGSSGGGFGGGGGGFGGFGGGGGGGGGAGGGY
ncbi:MAG: TPM domain-containing protein [Candidatus Omnitrophota bacterium]|jgi:uncharacterized protein